MAREILNLKGYTIVRRLGTGARSVIYLATEDAGKRQIALKRAIYERPEDSRIFEQIQNEYKVASSIDHPYIRKCYKLKKIRRAFKTRELLLAMEMFDGKSLEDGPALSVVDVLLVFRMVATGLNAMHHNGYIHCDIKPNNILMGPKGEIKIIDLGQGCRIGTRKLRIQGTPDYIAPEQVRREPLDQRTDIFNLGATMYWAFTGKNVPTLIPRKIDRITMFVPEEFPTPHQVHHRIPVGISMLVMDCVKDDPLERPATMSQVITRIDLLIHSILDDKAKKNAPQND